VQAHCAPHALTAKAVHCAQENFESKKKQLQHQKADLERRLSDARIAITHLRDVHARETAKQVREARCSISRASMTQGVQSRLAAEAEMQAKRVLERQNFVAEAAQRHLDVGMRFVGVPTPDEVHQFEEKVCWVALVRPPHSPWGHRYAGDAAPARSAAGTGGAHEDEPGPRDAGHEDG